MFGSDARTQAVARDAVTANPWFSEDGIVVAARNIAGNMLSRRALDEWLASYPSLPAAEPRDVLLVMAGNIPFVGFQDLLCVLSAGHRALVKMSSKDRVLMSYIIDELRDISPGIAVAGYDGCEIPGAVIAMGGDNAVRALRNRYSGLPAMLRGNRSSLAVLSGNETSGQMAGLAGDILSYSGLGCRNVSLVFVPYGYDIDLLASALQEWDGRINPKYFNNYLQTKALLNMSGVPFTDCGYCVLREDFGFPAAVSCVNYIRYISDETVADWIGAHDAEIQCIAGEIAHGRAVGFGRTQSPGLADYPDGCDTMQFLSRL